MVLCDGLDRLSVRKQLFYHISKFIKYLIYANHNKINYLYLMNKFDIRLTVDMQFHIVIYSFPCSE